MFPERFPFSQFPFNIHLESFFLHMPTRPVIQREVTSNLNRRKLSELFPIINIPFQMQSLDAIVTTRPFPSIRE